LGPQRIFIIKIVFCDHYTTREKLAKKVIHSRSVLLSDFGFNTAHKAAYPFRFPKQIVSATIYNVIANQTIAQLPEKRRSRRLIQ